MRKISRRGFVASAVAAIPATRIMATTNIDRTLRFYVGTYTSGKSKSKGIYAIDFEPKDGTFGEPIVAAGAEEPSFLCVSHDGKYLYAVNELLTFEGKDSGAVSAFAIDKNGGLTFLNRQPTLGGAPCHLSITDKGDLVLVANYLGGSVAAFPVNESGSLRPATDLIQHTGKGPNADRQEAPHCHSVIIDEHNKFAIVDDLGTDTVTTYAIDRKLGKLTPLPDAYKAKPGAGPRHFKFHPNGKFAFVNSEMDVTVTSLAWDRSTGKLSEIQTLSTLPADYKQTAKDSIADLHVSKDGKFLYVSNRGHDSIASFAIDEKKGTLTPIEIVKTGGKTPRNFALDPTGNFLLAANQNSNTITLFSIDRQTGKLTSTDTSVSVPSPVCIIFAR